MSNHSSERTFRFFLGATSRFCLAIWLLTLALAAVGAPHARGVPWWLTGLAMAATALTLAAALYLMARHASRLVITIVLTAMLFGLMLLLVQALEPGISLRRILVTLLVAIATASVWTGGIWPYREDVLWWITRKYRRP